jgi:hypothetical protein
MYITTLAILLCSGAARAQQPHFGYKVPFQTDRPTSAEEWRLQLVKHLMQTPNEVTDSAVQLHRMGDEAAVDVLKVLGASSSPTTADLQTALDIIHTAFEKPIAILDPINEKPRAAIFLLQYLGSIAREPATNQRIADEVKFVRAAASQVSPPTAAKK